MEELRIIIAQRQAEREVRNALKVAKKCAEVEAEERALLARLKEKYEND